MRKLLITVIIIILVIFSLNAENTAVDFLTYEMGARSVGMGKTFVAVADDGQTAFYNIAGGAFFDETSVYSSYQNISNTDQKVINFTFFYPMKNSIGGVFGLNFLYFDYGTSQTTNVFGEVINEFRIYETSIGLSYSREILKNLGFGLNLKYIYSHLFTDYTASDIAVDLGFLYKKKYQLKENLNLTTGLGVTLQNIGPKISYQDEEQADNLPRFLRTGVSLKLNYRAFNIPQYILTTYSIDKNTFEEMELGFIHKAGMEYSFKDMFYGRIGYYNDSEGDVDGLNWGLGIKYMRILFDFGVDTTNPFEDNIKTFSVGYIF
ncbi:MAG TPA: PorV/PorQ family protein [Candidatus Mcinerneyibacterium sp.]|nr:PorV/PorQ family protein [Candidatus Mcinerneyibacterium sp.]